MDRYSKYRRSQLHGKLQATNDACGYSNVGPDIFEVGDIVEASFAFVTLPIKGGRYVMIPQLRGLLLLDNSLRICLVRSAALLSHFYFPHKTGYSRGKQDERKGKNAPHTMCKQMGQLKRKALYSEEDEVVETQRKIVKMHIDQDAHCKDSATLVG